MSLRAYRAYGLAFASDIALPPLTSVRAARTKIHLVRPRRPLDLSGWRDAIARPDANGKPWLVVSRRGSEYRLEFDAADFVLRADGRTVDMHGRRGTPVSTLRHLALNQVLPIVLAHGGRTVLHASAIALEARSVVLLGPTGAGKSTLVASFAAGGRPMMSDDAVILVRRGRTTTVVPSYGDVRVWPDTYAMLRGIRKPVPFSAKPRPLAAMYLLTPAPAGSRIRIDALSRREGLIELVKYSFALDVTDRSRLVAQLDRLTHDSPFALRRVVYPRDFAALPRVRAAILADVPGRATG